MVSKTALRRSVPAGALPDFDPVPRQVPRHDGWTPERQRAFVAALADTGCVAIAARMVNMSPESAYQLRRAPGAASFRAAWDAAQTLGLLPVKDEAFHRAMHGQLVPVFVAGKLMGFRRKKNDRLLMFILRHYGEDAGGRKTTVNYFSTRASAGAGAIPPRDGEGDHAKHGGGGPGTRTFAQAEASATTVRTVISGGNAPNRLAAEDEAANLINAFEGVALDSEARAEIYRTLEACAERRRALEDDPENDPGSAFVPTGPIAYLGELESGAEGDWVEYRPEGEHIWENLGEGGQAAEIDRVLAEMEARKALPSPDPNSPLPPAGSSPPTGPSVGQACGDDDRGVGTTGPGSTRPTGETRKRSPEQGRRPYRKRTPKPPFAPPDEARKAEAVEETEAARREAAAAEAKRRKAKARRNQSPG